MQIKVLASGSSGNAYLVENGQDKLLIECGIPFHTLQKRLWEVGCNVSDLSGCLISHSHADHAKAVLKLLKHGVDCYMDIETANTMAIADHHRVFIVGDIQPTDLFMVMQWQIWCFPAVHDVPCLGFLLSSGNERLLYLTDSAYSPYTFPGLTHIMVGCNYSLDLLNANIEAGIVPREEKARLMHSHASLETVKDMLRANDLSNLREIHLIHGSDRNLDKEQAKREVQEIVGVPVYIH